MRELKEGQKVKERWSDAWGTGVCIKALKTVWHIKFQDGETRVYDKAHLQFLDLVDESFTKKKQKRKTVKIKQVLCDEIDASTYKKLMRLTLKEGYMGMCLEFCRKAYVKYDRTDFKHYIYICTDENEKIIGWAMVQDLLYRYEDFLDFGIFVAKSHRGKGIALKIMKEIAKKHKDKKFSVWVHDEGSRGLFKKTREIKDSPFVLFDAGKYKDGEKYIEWKE